MVKLAYVDSSVLVKHYVENEKSSSNASQLIHSHKVYVSSIAQIEVLSAAVSAMSNISEGFERGTDKEFNQFLNYARGSSAEVKSQLYVALDLGYITENDFNDLYSKCTDISKLIMGFINYLKNKAKP